MRYRVILCPDALQAIDEYVRYIAEDQHAPLNAMRWLRKALDAVDSLEHLPHRCPYAPENECRDYVIRVQIVDSCLFLYTVDDDAKAVHIIGFRHGSRFPNEGDLPSEKPGF